MGRQCWRKIFGFHKIQYVKGKDVFNVNIILTLEVSLFLRTK